MPELMNGEWISDQTDQTEYLGYDATHCEHGTFVGDAWGPDYMCGWCEDGVSLAEYKVAMAERADCRKRYKVAKIALDKRNQKWHDSGATKETDKALFDSIVRLAIWVGVHHYWKD